MPVWGYWILWNWSYKQLWAVMWVWDTEPSLQPSNRASVWEDWAIRAAQVFHQPHGDSLSVTAQNGLSCKSLAREPATPVSHPGPLCLSLPSLKQPPKKQKERWKGFQFSQIYKLIITSSCLLRTGVSVVLHFNVKPFGPSFCKVYRKPWGPERCPRASSPSSVLPSIPLSLPKTAYATFSSQGVS